MEIRSNSKNTLLLGGILLFAAVVALVKFFIIPNYFVIEDGRDQDNMPSESVDSLTKDKADFSLASTSYDPESVSVISNFEQKEDVSWLGNGVIDDKNYFEGSSSLGLVSTDRSQASVTLEKNIDMSKMEFVEFMIHIGDIETYESITLYIGDSALNNYYRYSLTNLKNGWNLVQIPKEKFIPEKSQESTFDWSQIEKIRFLAISRPSSIFLMRLDMLRIINNSKDFLKDWRTLKPEVFLSLFQNNEKNKLMARNMGGGSTASLKEVEDINDFSFVASVSPQTVGRSGLFIRGNYDNGYGYYFLIGGDKRNTWEIQKKNQDGWTKTEDKVQGVLQNVVFSRDKKYWLRVDAKSDVMEFYFSFDGKKFEKLGEIKDAEFRGGGVGITMFDSGSWGLFDDFEFKRL